MLKKMKPAWIAGNESIAVYRYVASGSPQVVILTRLREGLKELDNSFRKPFPERYGDINGSNSWSDFLKNYSNAVENRWSELLFYRPDMSSK